MVRWLRFLSYDEGLNKGIFFLFRLGSIDFSVTDQTGSILSVVVTLLCLHEREMAIADQKQSEGGCVLIKVLARHVYTHIIYPCHKIVFLFFQPFQSIKDILNLQSTYN